MKLRRIRIKGFRGIESLDWKPTSAIVCIVGPGDACKSTVLDAIEATLSPRWYQFTDADFSACDTSKDVQVEVTVGELSKVLLHDSRMGLHLRGWSPDGDLHDEPEDGDEPVLTVRLTVEAALDPVWELITDRHEPRVLSTRDRALFGVVRLGGEAERHLTWAQGSALSRLNNEKEDAAVLLSTAYRSARKLVAEAALPQLQAVATKVEVAAKSLGAYAATPYVPGLDTQRSAMSMGTLSLHALGVPIRLAGLGTRRLVSLAIQRLSVPTGAIVLIDELEHGLEPHRIRGALKALQDALARKPQTEALGQVLMTTHSSTTIVELSAEKLAVARREQGAVTLAPVPLTLQSLVRGVPEAFLARSVLVCEGKTEIGVIRALRDLWASRHGDEPVENRGVAVVLGEGTKAPGVAIALCRLGYRTCLLMDSDKPIASKERAEFLGLKGTLCEWGDNCAVEDRILADITAAGVQRVLDLASETRSTESIRDAVRAKVGVTTGLDGAFETWAVPGKTDKDLRQAIALAARHNSWFKQIEPGERLGDIVASELKSGISKPLSTVLASVETWAYG